MATLRSDAFVFFGATGRLGLQEGLSDAPVAGAGIDVDTPAIQLQRDGARPFLKSWQDLLARIAEKRAALAPR
jgi:hypothetical protein